MTEDKECAAEDNSEQSEMSEAEIDRNLAASFPASDPPSWTLGTDHHEDSRGVHRSVTEDSEAE